MDPLNSIQTGGLPDSFGASAPFGLLGGASCRCGGSQPAMGYQHPLLAMQQLNMNLLSMLMLLMGAGGGLNQALGVPAGPGGSASTQASPINSSAPAGEGAPTSTGGAVNLGPGTKVLMIGDSHTVGAFGTELDRQLRSTGAQVATYGASGSSATQWANGGTTSSGFVARGADGSVQQPPWNSRQTIPKLEELIAREKPGVIIVNLGANFRNGDPASQVRSLGEIARRHGIKLIWIGPPKTREDSGNDSSIKAFDQKMAAAMAPYGTYIASDPFTPTYSGGDGLHYGTEAGKKWAQGIFGQLTGPAQVSG